MPSWYLAGNERRMGPGPASIVEAPSGNIVYLTGVSKATVDGSNVNTAGSEIDTTGADFLVMAVADYEGGGGLTVADSKTNFWNPRTSTAVTGNSRVQIYWCKPTSVGSSHVFTAVGSSAFGAIAVLAFSGVHASPYDVEAVGNGTSATASAGSGITPSLSGELVIAGVSIGASSVSTISDSFIITAEAPAIAYGGGTHTGVGIAYKVQGSAAAVDPDWTLVGSAAWAAAIASFKAA